MAKTERVKVANRLYVDAQGKVVDDEALATGIRYEFLGDGPKAPPTWTVESQFSDFNDDGKRLAWLFGMKTWVGNLANQDLTADEINARLATVAGGEWPERQGVGGPRYDMAALAQAIMQAKGAQDPAPFAKRLADEKGYATMAMKVPAVSDIYYRLVGKSVTVDQL